MKFVLFDAGCSDSFLSRHDRGTDDTATAGRSAGARANLVTHSGTNTFHGDVFEFFRNNIFNAENHFSTISPDDRQNDFGYDVGGPLKKDRIFFWSQEWRGIVENSGPVITVAPTALEREGDFSESLIQPIAPPTGMPFPDNRTIPQDRLTPRVLRRRDFRRHLCEHPAANRGGPEHSDISVANDSHDERRLKPYAIG